MPNNLHEQITERMITALQDGTVPWQKPWGAASGYPRSMTTGERYKGINVLLLGMTAQERGYESPWWGTFNQVKKLGGNVLKGQNQASGTGSTTVVFYDRRSKEVLNEATGEAELAVFGIAKAFRVFNAAQCEGLPEKFHPTSKTVEALATPQAVLDGFIANGGPTLTHIAGDSAHYTTDGSDRIVLPIRDQFRSSGHYYAAAFHEATHSTGAVNRLDRPGVREFDHFGSGQYAKEELVAEMGSAMLLSDAGVHDEGLFNNSASYLHSWLGKLEQDHRLVSSAASQAHRAAEFIMTMAGYGDVVAAQSDVA